MLSIFTRPYTVRKHLPQEIIDGYTSAAYSDVTLRLDVQPYSPDDLQALPEGARTVKRVKSFGEDELVSANDFTGTTGDLLFYRGEWYECKSSVRRDHTPLGHYRSDFVVLPSTRQTPPPEASP